MKLPRQKLLLAIALPMLLLGLCLGGLPGLNGTASAARQNGGIGNNRVAAGSADQCGNDPGIVTSINIGCKGQGNPIADMAFAVIRVLSAGVGLVIVASVIVGGIQYSASNGDPQSTAQAVTRIRSSLYALILFIFAAALLNYVIPGAVLQ